MTRDEGFTVISLTSCPKVAGARRKEKSASRHFCQPPNTISDISDTNQGRYSVDLL